FLTSGGYASCFSLEVSFSVKYKLNSSSFEGILANYYLVINTELHSGSLIFLSSAYTVIRFLPKEKVKILFLQSISG
ncbi:826_t:CDS:1, partial [Diversispora eburnea]